MGVPMFNKDLYLKRFNLNVRNYRHLSILINDKNDYKEFFINFWDEENKFQSICKYRLHKIRKINLSFERFVRVYRRNEIKALELLFQHPVYQFDVDLLNEKIRSGKLTLEELFSLHKEEPGRCLLNILNSI